MSVEKSYDQWANQYDLDRNLTRDLDRELNLARFATKRFEGVLETGCGTGKNTTLFSQVAKRVVAVDFSSGMLQQARKHIGAQHVEFIQADLNSDWHFTSHQFDLISCNLVLEHLENLSAFFLRARGALKSDASLSIIELHPIRQYQGGQAHFFDRDGELHKVDAFVHHLSDYLNAAKQAGFKLKAIDEHWHPLDIKKPPRLISFEFSI